MAVVSLWTSTIFDLISLAATAVAKFLSGVFVSSDVYLTAATSLASSVLACPAVNDPPPASIAVVSE